VPNHDFSVVSNCPFTGGQLNLLTNWFTPNRSSTDLIHECGNEIVGIPDNQWGTQEPYVGSGYAGIRTFLANPPLSNKDYREYMGVELSEKLQADALYRVSFRVSPGEIGKYITDQVGAYLGDTILGDSMFTYQPVIKNKAGQWLNNFGGWKQISATYRAKGDERFLVVGNFLRDEATHVRISHHEGGAENSTYLFVDDVRVELCAADVPLQMIEASDTMICKGGEVTLASQVPDTYPVIWGDGTTTKNFTTNQSGIYTLTTDVNGCNVSDTLQIRETFVNNLQTSDTVICPGEVALLNVRDTTLDWSWQSGPNTAQIRVNQSGWYVLDTRSKGCLRRDSIFINVDSTAYFLGDTASKTDSIACGEELTLNVPLTDPLEYFTWEDGSKSSKRNISEAGVYTLSIVSHCTNTQLTYTISRASCKCEVWMPNVVTPNQDGHNDVLQPEFDDHISKIDLKVFDRWGRVIYRTQDQQEEWNPLESNQHVSEGVYFWSLRYYCADRPQEKLDKSGVINVLR